MEFNFSTIPPLMFSDASGTAGASGNATGDADVDFNVLSEYLFAEDKIPSWDGMDDLPMSDQGNVEMFGID